MFAAIGLWRYAIYTALIAGFVGWVAYQKHAYDERRREEGAQPYKAAIEHSKQAARELLAIETAKVKTEVTERDARIKLIVGAYENDRKKREAAFDLERATHGRLFDRDAQCGNGSNRAQGLQTPNAGSPKAGSGGVELSERANELLWNLIRDTQTTIEQYRTCQAYARELSE